MAYSGWGEALILNFGQREGRLLEGGAHWRGGANSRNNRYLPYNPVVEQATGNDSRIPRMPARPELHPLLPLFSARVLKQQRIYSFGRVQSRAIVIINSYKLTVAMEPAQPTLCSMPDMSKSAEGAVSRSSLRETRSL